MRPGTMIFGMLLILGALMVRTNCAVVQKDEFHIFAPETFPRKYSALSTSLKFKSLGQSEELSNQLAETLREESPEEKKAEGLKPSSDDKSDRPLEIKVKDSSTSQRVGRAASSSRRRDSYKVYVLDGKNIRHYRVNFPSRNAFTADVSGQQPATNVRPPPPRKVKRCIRRKYLARCISLPLKRKGTCTKRIVSKCVPRAIVVEENPSSTKTSGRVSPVITPPVSSEDGDSGADDVTLES